jgi:hypothetical protein
MAKLYRSLGVEISWLIDLLDHRGSLHHALYQFSLKNGQTYAASENSSLGLQLLMSPSH